MGVQRNSMKKILVRGPALTRSGYGEHTRFILRALRSREDLFDVYLLPVNWGKTGWIYEDNEERRWLDSIINKTSLCSQEDKLNCDISMQVTIPNEWENMAPINIGVTAGIETTRISPVWVEKGNFVDKIITISDFSKQSYEQTSYVVTDNDTGEVVNKSFRCTTPIQVVHYPVRPTEIKKFPLELTTKFNFLVNAQWSPRKNLENTIGWFIEEFVDNEEVGLVLKTNVVNNSLIDRIETEKRVKNLTNKFPDKKCKVYLLHGDLSAPEINSLYCNKNIKALISLAHGEGFGLPIFEAAYNGLPVIAPDWSGHTDYLYKLTKNKKGKIRKRPFFARVEYDLGPVQKEVVWKDVLVKDSMWCYPKKNSYKEKLREIYRDHGRFKSQASKLKTHLCENFTSEQKYKQVVDIVQSVPTQNEKETEIDSMFDSLMASNA
jgi:glycosyltransferase involved in cell wall biosynthesis